MKIECAKCGKYVSSEKITVNVATGVGAEIWVPYCENCQKKYLQDAKEYSKKTWWQKVLA